MKNLNNNKTILFPLLRDIKTIPPTISIIHFLAQKGYRIILFTYFTDLKFDNPNISIIKFKNKPYPLNLIKRILENLAFHLYFYYYFLKNRSVVQLIWIGAWDIWGLNRVIRNIPLVYQFHEYEEKKFVYCRKADYVVVPEENRAWITYFKANLKKLPILLPNIPNYGEFELKPDYEILEFQNNSNIVILYSGLIDNKKRNLFELVSAFKFLPDEYILTIMPSFISVRNDLEKLIGFIEKQKLSHRIKFIKSRTPPQHINTMATADIGVGFYNATSINNVYAAPNRLYEFVNFNTPLILPNYPGFKSLSQSYPFAVNVSDPTNPKEIAKVIIDINLNKQIAIQSIKSFKEKEGSYEFFASKLVAEIFQRN